MRFYKDGSSNCEWSEGWQKNTGAFVSYCFGRESKNCGVFLLRKCRILLDVEFKNGTVLFLIDEEPICG